MPLVFLLQLKNKLQVYTLGIGGVGLVSSYITYSPEIAARYAHFSLDILWKFHYLNLTVTLTVLY
jgi:ATP synthase protein I